MAEGRSAAEKTALMKSVTEAVHSAIGAPLPTIHVMIQEIPAADIMVAGKLLTETDDKVKI